MVCAICSHSACGMANLRGKRGTYTEGASGCYPLCKSHLEDIHEGRWDNVILEGWEEFPEMEKI